MLWRDFAYVIKAPDGLDLITGALQSRELSSTDSSLEVRDSKFEDGASHVNINTGGHQEQTATVRRQPARKWDFIPKTTRNGILLTMWMSLEADSFSEPLHSLANTLILVLWDPKNPPRSTRLRNYRVISKVCDDLLCSNTKLTQTDR